MPQLQMQLPQVQDVPWQDFQSTFNGAWMPDLDPALIGNNNYATLQNLRYKDNGLEGVNGYCKVNNTTALSARPYIRNGIQLISAYDNGNTSKSYTLVSARDGTNADRVYLNTTEIGVDGDFQTTANLDPTGGPSDIVPYIYDNTLDLDKGRFSQGTKGTIVYCNGKESKIFSGYEARIAAAFQCDDSAGANPVDVTDLINNSITTRNITWTSARELWLFTTRPAQGFKFYVGTANSGAGTTIVVQTWTGSAWTDVTGDSDGTLDVKTMATTGFYRFNHTGGNVDGGSTGGDAHSTMDSYAKCKHFEGLLLYAYRFDFTDASQSAVIYQVTADFGFQPLQNIWDGIYRQPIQFQLYDGNAQNYYDYTLHVNQSSDANSPVAADFAFITDKDNDVVYIIFSDPVSAMRFTILDKYVNTATSAMTVKYWNGTSWVTTGATDLTSFNNKTLARSGLIYWNPVGTAEKKRTLFGTTGYAYQVSFSVALTASDTNIYVDFCVGIPALLNNSGLAQQEPFEFSALYGNRLMLGCYEVGAELNRMDYSADGSPDVWNGTDTSDGGKYSLYFGDQTRLTGAAQIYNRFGSNIYKMLVVFKDNETYVLTGDTPSEFQIFPVSQTIGCPAPGTIATTEMSFEQGEQAQRQVAIWLSHAGPVTFDGAVLSSIPGMSHYFDPGEGAFVDWDYVKTAARGWVDHVFKEYNLLIPSMAPQSTNNVWLVYDLVRKKWFKKSTGLENTPQVAWNCVTTDTGEQAIYGGQDSGYLIEIEHGTSWNCTYASTSNGTAIEQKLRSADLFLSNNIWDRTTVRKFYLLCEKLAAAAELELSYYQEGANSASNTIWMDSDSSIGVNVDFYDMDVDSDSTNETQWESAVIGTQTLNLDIGTDRIVRLILDRNDKGWAHAYEMTVSTTSVSKGFKPIAWGLQWRVEGKENKATATDD